MSLVYAKAMYFMPPCALREAIPCGDLQFCTLAQERCDDADADGDEVTHLDHAADR